MSEMQQFKNEVPTRSMSQKMMALQDSLVSPENLEHHIKLSEMFAKSNMVPKNYIGKPMDILIAWEMGYQLGLPYMQALQDIAVINGKACLYGDGFVAVIKSHPDYEWMKEGAVFDGNIVIGYSCTIKRRNHDPHTVTFTVDDAKRAKLLGKPGPWSDYPIRMMKWRAVSWCGRDVMADALRGVKSAEEVNDYIDGELEIIKPASKTEQLKNKLQGMSNDKKAKAIMHDTTDAVIVDTPVSSEPESVVLPKDAKGSVDESPVGKTGKQKTISEPMQEPLNPITDSQLADIRTLISDKKFSDERQQKALKHYSVTSFGEMTAKQADEFLDFLDKVKE
ncbi:MAG: hypothetical protein KA318_00170 [Nitrosomonas sp.]|nr:hypothetical protein [Nitrosomonas sp.]